MNTDPPKTEKLAKPIKIIINRADRKAAKSIQRRAKRRAQRKVNREIKRNVTK